MNGDRGAAVKQIIQAIEYGTLPTDETQRRLMELIQKEANRIDGPADEELMSACIDLMERLQGREHVEDEARIAALNQRIAESIQKKQRRQKHRHTAFRAVGAIAAVVVLLVGIGVPLRWTWFESWSTPDEQQHVIIGHEITVDMVTAAIAENEAKEPIPISDFAEFEKHLGFDPTIPLALCNDWTADHGLIQFFSGYIQIVARYVHTENPEKSITCTVCYFTDVEYAYFSFEQNRAGDKVQVNDIEVYVSDNMERSAACWYNNNMYVWLSGDVAADESLTMILNLIGGSANE